MDGFDVSIFQGPTTGAAKRLRGFSCTDNPVRKASISLFDFTLS